MRATVAFPPAQVALGRHLVWLALLLALTLAACAVRFVSEYDDVLDRTATETQQKVTVLFNQLQDPSSPSRRYDKARETYDEIAGDLHAMRTRAEANNAGGRNADTLTIITTLEDNLELVREQHRLSPRGLPSDFVRPAQELMDVQFRALIQLELAKKRGATPS